MDPTGFKQASRAVWDAMAQGWDERHAMFEATAWPVTERMLERAALRPGETVLDVAAGTGVVAFAAAAGVAPEGRVIASDFSPAMVEGMTRRAVALGIGNVEARVLDAERMDLQDDVVDAVLCRWGYMLMGDPAAAVAESRRVLRPGGRLACAVFAGPEQNPWAALPMRVLDERGHVSAAERTGPSILALADRDRLAGLFTAAGFGSVGIDEVGFVWTFGDMDDFWAFLADAAGAIAMVIARLEAEERAAVREVVAERIAPFRDGSAIRIPAACLVLSAS
jgi:ubiquinone/menaquinone biosynthesis C-methylase UbiE